MADEVKNGLSADASRIASQWNRSTVADGSWLQKYTLSPLTARDYYLASAIDSLGSATDDTTSALSAAISSVSSIHDEYINYLSSTINTDVSGYIDYVSGRVDSLSSEFKTSANAISSKLDKEIQRASEVEEVLQNQINLINASTDVINVYGNYGGVNGFSVESAYYFDPAKTATYHLTNNDIIKIINDEYTPVEETGQLTTGHQTYYQWINNEGVTGDPQSPSDGSWNFIGYTEPYYNITEVDNKFSDISSTISNTFLSANGTAVQSGHNIVISTHPTEPRILIETSGSVTFTGVSATTLSATTAYGSSAKFTTGNFTNLNADNVTATNIQGTGSKFTNFSGTNLSGSTKHDTIDNLFGSAYSGAAASAWVSANSARLDVQAGYGLETGEDEGHLVIGLHQDHCDYYGHSLALGSWSTANGDNSYAFGMSCDTIGGAALAIGDNACATTGAVALGTYNSAMGKYSLALGYNTTAFNQFSVAIGRGLSGEAPITLGTWNDNVEGATFIIGDGTGTQEGHDVVRKNALVIKDGLISGRDFSAGNVSLSSLTNISAFGNGITNTATFNLSAVKLSAGQGIGFKNDSGILSISSEGARYTGENYVEVDNTNKKIKLSGNLVNSAQSGQSAYNWITSKSATLQAGQGIGFYSAGPNILGISAEGTSYTAGRCIEISSDKSINLSANVSATSLYTYEGASTNYSACSISSNGISFVLGGSNTNYPYYRNAFDGDSINIHYDNKHGNIQDLIFKSNMLSYAQTATAPDPTYTITANWGAIASASKLSEGSGINFKTTGDKIEITMSAIQAQSGVINNTRETSDYTVTSLYFRPEWLNDSHTLSYSWMGVSSNGKELGVLAPTPTTVTSNDDKKMLVQQYNGVSNNNKGQLVWQSVSSVMGNYISGDGTITAMVTAANPGSNAKVLYLI